MNLDRIAESVKELEKATENYEKVQSEIIGYGKIYCEVFNKQNFIGRFTGVESVNIESNYVEITYAYEDGYREWNTTGSIKIPLEDLSLSKEEYKEKIMSLLIDEAIEENNRITLEREQSKINKELHEKELLKRLQEKYGVE